MVMLLTKTKITFTLIISSLILALIQFPFSVLSNFNYRKVSINLGGGECEWTPPKNESDVDCYKTLLVGYPGGAHRMVYSQMEALAGIKTNDEWPLDVPLKNRPNRPFWKANYPHHEGYWTWGGIMNQTIYAIRNPRYAIKEYHDVLWDIDYATSTKTAYSKLHKLYVKSSSMDEFATWRDDRTLREIHWYSWHIDYWMENGLLRDSMSHNLTTPKHFFYMLRPVRYGDDGLLFNRLVGNQTVEPYYDDHCVNDMHGKCRPMAIVSVERLMDPVKGPEETAKIASTIYGKPGLNVIAEEAWKCIWEELIIHRKGPRTMLDRIEHKRQKFSFTIEQLGHMVNELTRLKDKYSSPEWSFDNVASDLVKILGEYIIDITTEMLEFQGAVN